METVKSDSLQVITISFVGDIMCHSPQYEYAQVTADSFNFYPVFRYVKRFLNSSDYTCGNLETVTSGGTLSGYPLFNTPVQYLDALKDAGFDFLFTSNNHCLDRGEKGILNTVTQLDKRAFMHTGTFISQSDRDSLRIVNIKGFRLALLSYTYGTNGNYIPKEKKYLVNVIDTALIRGDIQKVRLYADMIIVYFHFGEEYQTTPNRFQETIAAKTAEYGADAIIASHPHVIQPLRYIKRDTKKDSVFTAFSLGNFVSNQRGKSKDSGVILNLMLEKNYTRNSAKLKEFSFIPTWVFKGYADNKNQYYVLPCRQSENDSTLTFLSTKDRMDIKRSFLDTQDILLKYITPQKLQVKMGINSIRSDQEHI